MPGPLEIKAEIFTIVDPGVSDDPVWVIEVQVDGDELQLDGSWPSVGEALDALMKWAGDRAYTLRDSQHVALVPLEIFEGP